MQIDFIDKGKIGYSFYYYNKNGKRVETNNMGVYIWMAENILVEYDFEKGIDGEYGRGRSYR